MPHEIIPRTTLLNFTSSQEQTYILHHIHANLAAALLEENDPGTQNMWFREPRDPKKGFCVLTLHHEKRHKVNPTPPTYTNQKAQECGSFQSQQDSMHSHIRSEADVSHTRVCNRLILMQVPAVGRERNKVCLN